MTRLLKPVTRVVGGLEPGRPNSEIAVTLLPGGRITFRRLGTRRTFELSLETCYLMAARIAAEALREERQRRRRGAR